MRIYEATQRITPKLEHIYFNSQYGFTLQTMLLLSPLLPEDSETTIFNKLNHVSTFLDILLTWRLWNFRSIAYSTMQYSMFVIMRDIRSLEPDSLANTLYSFLINEKENFTTNDRLRVHQQNRYMIHRILARLTDYVETQSGNQSHYQDYVKEGKNRYEVEHIWADHPERYEDEFNHPSDFSEYRNQIGGLLLLPQKFNNSFGDLSYEKKLPHYNSQNLLARSLNKQCYDHNPGFLRFVQESNLPFKSYDHYKKVDLEERSLLYKQIAEKIWNPEELFI